MAVLWSLTCAAVILLLFQDNDLSHSIQPVITIKNHWNTQGEMSDRSSYQPFGASGNCEMLKIILSKRKLVKIIRIMKLFQHQVSFALHLTCVAAWRWRHM